VMVSFDFSWAQGTDGAAIMAENVAAACRKVRRFKVLFPSSSLEWFYRRLS
jgi:hypothetical protein